MFCRDSCSPGLCWKSEEAQKYKPVYVKKKDETDRKKKLAFKI